MLGIWESFYPRSQIFTIWICENLSPQGFLPQKISSTKVFDIHTRGIISPPKNRTKGKVRSYNVPFSIKQTSHVSRGWGPPKIEILPPFVRLKFSAYLNFFQYILFLLVNRSELMLSDSLWQNVLEMVYLSSWKLQN